MKIKKIIASHLLVLGLIFPHTVSAEDFNFNVGAKFSNLHPFVNALKIVCTALQGTSTIGVGSHNMQVGANRTINETVQIKFNAIVDGGEAHPERADNYRCNFHLYREFVDNSKPLPANNKLCKDTKNDWKCAKEGKKLVAQLTGKISRSSKGNTSGIKPRKGSKAPAGTLQRKSGAPLRSRKK